MSEHAQEARSSVLEMIQKLIAQNMVLHDAMEKIVDDEDDAGKTPYERMSLMASRARIALARTGAIEKYDAMTITAAGAA